MREGRIISAAVAADMANPDFNASRWKILIVRLSPFRDIEVSYSHLVLFDESRRALPDSYIDFAFLPPEPDRKELTEAGRPWFYGRASGKAPSEFNLILISCAFTLELVNIPWILAQSGIPSSRAERHTRPDAPILILGGSSAVTAGALIRAEGGRVVDSIVDGIFFGEGEGSISEIVRTAAEGNAQRISTDEILDRISAQVPGFWPCDEEHRVVRALAAKRPAVLTSPLALNGENADHAKLAITAGCVGHCAFCLEGWDRRPFREHALSDIRSAARALKKWTGATDVELFSYNFNMHHRVESIIPALGRYFMRVSLMSQRLDVLARSPTLLSAEIAAGKRSFTLGIEGISDRMRQYFRKGITRDEVHKSAADIIARDARELKLFYIISGLENEDDFAEFGRFIEDLATVKSDSRAHTRIIVSAGYLVRLPFTPLQFAPLAANKDQLSSLSRQIEKICASVGMEYRLAASFEDYWADQLLSVSGYAANGWILACPERGDVYDGRLTRGTSAALASYLLCLRDFPELLAEKSPSYRPAFAFIENEDHWRLLRSHYEKSREAFDGSVRPSRLPVKLRPSEESSLRAISTIGAQEAAKARFQPVVARVVEREMMAFSTPEYERAWLIRSLAACVPDAERAIFDCRLTLPDERWSTAFSMLFDQRGHHFGFCGVKHFSLYGPDSDAITSIIARASVTLKALDAPQQLLPREYPGSIAGLQGIESVENPRHVDYCTLKYTTSTDRKLIVSRIVQFWLKETGVHFTINTYDDRHDFIIAPDSMRKKAVQSAVINTSSSELSLNLRIGYKTDLRTLSEAFKNAFLSEDTVFTIESWE